jgi:hypothetical protein
MLPVKTLIVTKGIFDFFSLGINIYKRKNSWFMTSYF